MSHILKKTICSNLESNDLDAVVLLSKGNKKVLSQLVRLAYDKETLVGWRAIKAIGLAARELVATDYAFLREMIRKLLWSLSDESGGIGWSAPEILGEIVSVDPERFRDIIPLIAEVYDIEEKVFRPGILYALGKIAVVKPGLIVPHKDLIIRALSDENPLTRVYALEAIMTLKGLLSTDDLDVLKRILQNLSTDRAEVWVFKGDSFVSVQVSEAAPLP